MPSASKKVPEARVKLPRGINAASREVVRASQRERLIAAMTAVTAAKGYPDVTIADIVKAAGVAKPTFYDHFRDKEACFLEVYDIIAQGALDASMSVFDPLDGPKERVVAGVTSFLAYLAADDARARILLVESMRAGGAATARVSGLHQKFAARYIASREEVRAARPEYPPISETRALAIVGAVNEPICEVLRRENASRLPELADELIIVAEALSLATP